MKNLTFGGSKKSLFNPQLYSFATIMQIESNISTCCRPVFSCC